MGLTREARYVQHLVLFKRLIRKWLVLLVLRFRLHSVKVVPKNPVYLFIVELAHARREQSAVVRHHGPCGRQQHPSVFQDDLCRILGVELLQLFYQLEAE